MKTYVQYFATGVQTGKLIEACGDRSIVQLDGRNSVATMHRDAREFNGNSRPHYHAYQLIRGNNLRDAKPISDIKHLI